LNPFLAISSLSFSASSQASSETFFSCLQEEKRGSFYFNFQSEDCQWHSKKETDDVQVNLPFTFFQLNFKVRHLQIFQLFLQHSSVEDFIIF
jgi:hypothetical protein